MSPFTNDWKSPLALLIAVLLLYFISLRVDARRIVPAPAKAPASAPADPGDGKPPSNDVGDFQQLG